MADPTQYTVTYNFSDFQSNNPTTPLPAPKVDNELANIATAIAALVTAAKDVRNPDGTLKNGLVTYNSLALGLQLTFDPTNGQAVAAAVATAQAAQAAASGSATAANTSATNAQNSANAAAASASSVNLNLFFPKAGNLAGVGSADTARANLNAAKVDGSDMIGRIAPLTGATVTDWNNVLTSGWFSGTAAANAPDGTSNWLGQVIAVDAFSVTQILYLIGSAPARNSAVTIFRRHAFNNAGVRTWNPWDSAGPVPIGAVLYMPAQAAPDGFLKLNGALVSRASFSSLYAFASGSGNIASEANWPSFTAAFSTGDLATSFRLPDLRGEFVRGWDDSRGVDTGRGMGAVQAADNAPHTHGVTGGTTGATSLSGTGTGATSALNGGAAITISSQGGEGRPRNVPLLACIKY